MNKFVTNLAIISGLCFFFAGCATQAPKPRILWPADEPRIEWLGNYYGDQSFPKTATEKLINEIAGETQPFDLIMPFDGVSDSVGNIFITDVAHQNVLKYDFTNLTVESLFTPGILKRPMGIAIDSRDQLYVADAIDDSIKIFTNQGLYVKTFKSQDHLSRPVNLAINERLNRLYVSDADKSHIAVFDLTGAHLFNIGSKGDGEGELYSPQGIAINSTDEVYVADTLHSRIQAFDADGTFIRSFGEIGDQLHQFERPKDLAFDSEDNLHIVDDRKGMHTIYKSDGTLLLASGGKVSANFSLGMSTPKGIYIDNDDRIIIVDMILKRFMLFQFLSERGKAKNPVTPADIQYLQEYMKQHQPKTR